MRRDTPPEHWTAARKRIVAACAVLIALAGFSVARFAPLFIDGDDYAAVESIERRADFRDPRLLAAAWQLPVAATYGAGRFEYQSTPSFCGPASAANLLRSMGFAATQATVIEGTPYDPWFGVLIGGLTLDEFADLLRTKTARPTTIIRDATLREFRAHLQQANDPQRRYVVNFHRGPLFGRGHGHFSPVLGYDASRDLVFVGDVNEAYGPFLVSSERLWHATNTVDGATGKKRGLVLVNLGDRTR